MRSGIGRAHGCDGGQRHHGVADPVGAADQDFVQSLQRQFIFCFQHLSPSPDFAQSIFSSFPRSLPSRSRGAGIQLPYGTVSNRSLQFFYVVRTFMSAYGVVHPALHFFLSYGFSPIPHDLLPMTRRERSRPFPTFHHSPWFDELTTRQTMSPLDRQCHHDT